MSIATTLGGLAAKIAAVHEMLDSMRVPHQFGGAVALAWYRSPRATTDVDLNVTVAPEDAEPILGAVTHLGVTVTTANRATIERDGQVRLGWDESYLDLFFATIDLHREMARHAREVEFGPMRIPILSPEHLIVCKAVFDRPKDWVDIEEMIAWGTEIDGADVMRWIEEILGVGSAQHERLVGLLQPVT